MTDSKDNPQQQPTASEYAAENKTEKPAKLDKKKTRLKFREEDTIEIKYNF